MDPIMTPDPEQVMLRDACRKILGHDQFVVVLADKRRSHIVIDGKRVTAAEMVAAMANLIVSQEMILRTLTQKACSSDADRDAFSELLSAALEQGRAGVMMPGTEFDDDDKAPVP